MRSFSKPPVVERTRPCARFLCEIATNDAVGESATDLRVVGRGEDLGVAGLASVVPALGLLAALVEQVQLAKPSANESMLKLAHVLDGSKDLAVGSGVELVRHYARGRLKALQGVGFELGALLEGLETKLLAVLGNDGHVAGL